MAHNTNIKKVILDSNIWIGYFIDDDSLHARSLQVMDDVKNTVVIIPEYILLEVVTVLKNKKHYTLAKTFAQKILGNNSMYLPASSIARLVAEACFNKECRNLSFVDTALLVLSKEYEIITFDTDLQKAINTI